MTILIRTYSLALSLSLGPTLLSFEFSQRGRSDGLISILCRELSATLPQRFLLLSAYHSTSTLIPPNHPPRSLSHILTLRPNIFRLCFDHIRFQHAPLSCAPSSRSLRRRWQHDHQPSNGRRTIVVENRPRRWIEEYHPRL
jgi:hypothetical protein